MYNYLVLVILEDSVLMTFVPLLYLPPTHRVALPLLEACVKATPTTSSDRTTRHPSLEVKGHHLPTPVAIPKTDARDN